VVDLTEEATGAEPVALEEPVDRGSPGRNRLTGRAAVLVMVVVMLAVAYGWPVREFLRQRAELNDLRAATRSAQATVAALQAQKDLWADPAYVKAQARARLHYVMPGEVMFVVLHPNQPNLVQTLPRTATTPPPSWYDALWTSLHGADDPSATTPTP